MAEAKKTDYTKYVSDKDKCAALMAALDQIRAVTKKDLVRFGGEIGTEYDIQWQRTNSPALNFVMGRGVPRGRIITIYGPESGGKSLICALIAAAVQAQGGVVAWHDYEWALEPKFVGKLGVDYNKLLLSRPDTAEEGFTIIEKLAQSQAIDLLIVDSVPAMLTEEEMSIDASGMNGDKNLSLAAKARFLSQQLPRLVPIIGNSPMTLIFINQVRDNVGVMYGPTETEPGGRALKFYSSIRLDVRRMTGDGAVIKVGEKMIGHNIRVRGAKNKCSIPFRESLLTLYYDSGIDAASQYLKVGMELGVIALNGNAYVFGDQKWVGKEKLKEALRTDVGLQEKIVTAVDEKLYGGDTLAISAVATAEDIPA